MLDQPSPNIILPSDLQDAIDAARVNLSILESKATVLNATNTGILKDNATLLKRQEFLTGQTIDLQANIDKLTILITNLQAQNDTLVSANSALDIEIADKKQAQTDLENDYNTRLAELEKGEAKLDSDNVQLVSDRNALTSEEKSFNEKVSKLSSFIANLT